MVSLQDQEASIVTKSVMFVPICNGDHIAAAVLDYLYTRFKFYQEFELAGYFEKGYSRDTYSGYNQYLSINEYPDRWLHVRLGELRRQASQEMDRHFWAGKHPHTGWEVLIESIQLLQAKAYICVEDWGLFDEDEDRGWIYAVEDYPEHLLTCWVYRNKIDADIVAFYRRMCTPQQLTTAGDRTRQEKRKVEFHNDRAYRVGLPATLTLKEWWATLDHFQWTCAFCLTRPYRVLEHFVPLVHGGGTTVYNCVPSCARCNALKNDRLPSTIPSAMGMEEAIARIQSYLDMQRQKWLT